MLQEARTNATVILQDAINEAAGIRAMYQQQAEIAANITKTNGLSVDGWDPCSILNALQEVLLEP